MNATLKKVKANIISARLIQRAGTVSKVNNLIVESSGPDAFLGEECEIFNNNYGNTILAEVVSLQNGKVILMPYGDMKGVSLGSQVVATGRTVSVKVGDALLGRIIDGFGNPLDSKPVPNCSLRYPLYGEPINPLSRKRIRNILSTGIRVIDSLLTIGAGQRIGIFSGSGVGKSSLLGMISRHMSSDVNVIALIGERGREVNEFIEEILGEEGLKRSVVIVATSDQPALKRTHAAHAATSIAEYFRDQGLKVTLVMDSVTRFAMAMREIGLAIGEPPTTRGYTPSVFATLPKLLERCGTTMSGGSITAFYSVLVEGDDLNDPISDSVRAILDGHIVLDRKIANKGLYPPVNILTSKSRLINDVTSLDDQKIIREIIGHYSTYVDSKDMIDLGLYKSGSNKNIDLASSLVPKLQEYFSQPLEESTPRETTLQTLNAILRN